MNNNYNNWSGIPQGVRPPVYKNDEQKETQFSNQESLQPEIDNHIKNITGHNFNNSNNTDIEENRTQSEKYVSTKADNNSYQHIQQLVTTTDNTLNDQQQPSNAFQGNNPQQTSYTQPHTDGYYQSNQIKRGGYYQQPNNQQLSQLFVSNGYVYNGPVINEEKQKQLDFIQSLKKTSNKVGGSMLIFWGLTQVLSIFLMIPLMFTNVFNYNSTIGTVSLDTVSLYILNAILLLISLPLSGIILTKMNGQRLEDVLHLKKSSIGDTTKLTVAGMGFAMVFNLLLTLMNNNLSLFGFKNEMTDYGQVSGVAEYILYFFSITIVPAIAEEFLFRGAVLGVLRKYGDITAIIISSALFGIMHGNLVQTPVTFLIGLVLGYLTVKTGSIIPSMILHFVNNSLVVVTEIIYSFIKDETTLAVVDLSIMIAIIIAGLICTAILLKKHKEKLFTFEKPENNIAISRQIACSFATPCTIIFIILTAGTYLLSLVTASGLQ